MDKVASQAEPSEPLACFSKELRGGVQLILRNKRCLLDDAGPRDIDKGDRTPEDLIAWTILDGVRWLFNKGREGKPF